MLKWAILALVGCLVPVGIAGGAFVDISALVDSPPEVALAEGIQFYRLIVGGDPSGTPPDNPAYRVDANVPTSPFAGVGSVRANATGGYYCGTGTLVSPWHVLTAAHVVDVNDDGAADFSPGAVSFYVNNGPAPTIITAEHIDIHPAYTGFNNPGVNDDLVLITLSEPAPVGVPWYPLWSGAIAGGQQAVAVGYGRSGSGMSGYTVGASLTVKRVGYNVFDVSLEDDDLAQGSGILEVWLGDFDGPTTGTNLFGGGTLGNEIEATLGPGDSGGPSFIELDGQLYLAGINTFGFSVDGGGQFPLYGSGMGGMLLEPYADWVTAVVPAPPTILLLAAGLPALMLRRRRGR